ncbi:ABC transporter permease subunit [Actinomadura macra]|uniref:ABC transporter permease subunit n=1 Tax=Actinomadura macra TaxID=46164 RepID=UPI0008306420|nr:ABC transporter permease subunit [Actinomadura macra]
MTGALHAEWIKLRSVRSTYVILAVTLGLGLGVGLMGVSSTAAHWATLPAADKAAFDPVGACFEGFQYAQLALVVLGILVIGPEYGTGQIRVTFTAVPRRRTVFLAKAVVLGAFASVVSLVSVFGTFALCQVVLSGKDLNVGLGEPRVLRAVVCAGLYMAVVTMVGFGLGAFLRHTSAALAAAFGLVFLAWPAARAVEGISNLPNHLVLVNAAEALATVHDPAGPHATRVPSFGTALLDLILYLVVFLGLGAWRLTRDP